jgi:hypothetical protein
LTAGAQILVELDVEVLDRRGGIGAALGAGQRAAEQRQRVIGGDLASAAS